ncbi:ATP phosphoribosyltransferase regulatory subunit [Carnobacterium iners]|uniref:ATP phosphoribosyltransferase regulatory subunit n=1 Tax=Carnobacterium iners TaxID=1073423 RepID=A0A1X7MW26_9LACT|nr:ATP phosphoribosyltransferase regulatory subunit [Carnobacterium iners]SEK17746.1 ATP phosphoribosyltransferase regulatory subunit [Carnobacterium iners]SMH29083.1 ATP phosphoribosyltransferase regulatory subunit [Carnobacterium iners]
MQFRTIAQELEKTKIKKDIKRGIENYFEKTGFSLIEPKTFQDYDDFINSAANPDLAKTVKVLGGDSKIYVLRPDITTNILSQIFTKWDGKKPLKVYYNSKIYRNELRGNVAEDYQMGIESLGDNQINGDREVFEIALNLMSKLDKDYILELGSSNYLDSFFKERKLADADELAIKTLISRKNRDELKGKLKSLKLENTMLTNILDMQGSMEKVITMAKTYETNKEMKKAIRSLESLNEYFFDKGVTDNIKVDLSMVPDLDYYDGIIFKGYCSNKPTKILSGGRYDKSTEKYGLTVSAIGFMIDMNIVTEIRMEGKN